MFPLVSGPRSFPGDTPVRPVAGGFGVIPGRPVARGRGYPRLVARGGGGGLTPVRPIARGYPGQHLGCTLPKLG